MTFPVNNDDELLNSLGGVYRTGKSIEIESRRGCPELGGGKNECRVSLEIMNTF